jgi:hypothetical protein
MKRSSKSLLAVKAAASQSSSNPSRTEDRAARLGACNHHDILLLLVRLLAPQTAREWAARDLEGACTPTLPDPEKQR